MKWLEITVYTRPSEVELVGNIFVELGSGGVVVADPASFLDPRQRVTGYLPVDRHLPARLAILRRFVAGTLADATVTTRTVDAAEWSNWREAWRPFPVGRRLLVTPSWEGPAILSDGYLRPDGPPTQNSRSPAEEGERLVVEIEPGPAFGFDHPTTVLCLKLLEESIRGGERMADVGTGSGILAIAAARLGAARVLAVDCDPVAVRAARENVSRNGLTRRISVREGYLLKQVRGPFDLVVANLTAEAITELLSAASRVLVPGGRLIASGITERKQEGVYAALAREPLGLVERRTVGEWVAFVAVRR